MVIEDNQRVQVQGTGALAPDLAPVVEPELVPVFIPGKTVGLPKPLQAAALALPDDLLSDALFGEVIDISDVIPRVMSPSADASTRGISTTSAAERMQPGLNDCGDILAAPGEVTGLTYDDGILASDGTIL
jgi:hypothetical protein